MSQYVAKSPSPQTIQWQMLTTPSVDTLLVNGLLVVCLSILLTVSDAFNTTDLSFAHRLSLWIIFSFLLVSQLCLFHRGLLLKLAQSATSRSLAIGMAVGLTALFMTVELHWLKYTPLLPKEHDPFFEFFIFIVQPVAALSLLILLAQTNSIRQYVQDIQDSSDSQIKSNIEIGELCEISKSDNIRHILAHDHYLEVRCENGKHFVRGRMKDVAELLAENNGIQIHRSHWVADDHIERAYRSGRDVKLLLADGSRVPVARSRVNLVVDKL